MLITGVLQAVVVFFSRYRYTIHVQSSFGDYLMAEGLRYMRYQMLTLSCLQVLFKVIWVLKLSV